MGLFEQTSKLVSTQKCGKFKGYVSLTPCLMSQICYVQKSLELKITRCNKWKKDVNINLDILIWPSYLKFAANSGVFYLSKTILYLLHNIMLLYNFMFTLCVVRRWVRLVMTTTQAPPPRPSYPNTNCGRITGSGVPRSSTNGIYCWSMQTPRGTPTHTWC